MALFADTEVCKWKQVVDVFFLSKKVKKRSGARRKLKKAIVYGSLFYEHPHNAEECPLLEFEQGLGVVLMVHTGYLNV